MKGRTFQTPGGLTVFKRKTGEIKFTTAYLNALHAIIEGDEESAIQLLREEVHREPRNFHAYLRLGILLRKRGSYNRAIQVHLEQTVRPRLGRNERKQLLYELALDYKAAGRNKEAEETLQGILGFDRGDVRIYKLLFQIYEDEERWEEAFETLVELQKKRKMPDSVMLAKYRAFIGKTYLDAKQIPKAESQFKKGIRLDSTNLAVLYHYGDLLASAKKWNKAISLWKKAIELSPDSIGIVLLKLEQAYYESGKYEKLLGFLEKQLDRVPSQIDLMIAVARLYNRKGRKNEALDLLDRALEVDPFSPEARRMKIEFLSEEDRLGEAVRESLEFFGTGTKRYRCPWCRTEFEEYLWRCSSCLRWETLKQEGRIEHERI